MNETETFASAWDAIADTPEQAANLRTRSELIHQIAEIIKVNNWRLLNVRHVHNIAPWQRVGLSA